MNRQSSCSGRRVTVKRHPPLALAALAALFLVAGCRGGGARQRETLDQSTQTSIAAGDAAVLVLTAQNIRLDKSSLTAPAGAIAIRFDNRDNGVPHSLHLFAGVDATSATTAHTEISVGPTTAILTVDLAAGTYFYQCDVHPSVMNGLLTVTSGAGPARDDTPLP